MTSALYSVAIDYLDAAHTHPNLPPSTISWDGAMAIVHKQDFSLWTEGEIASDGLIQAFRNMDYSLLEREIEASPLAEVAFREIGGVGHNLAGSGSFCSFDDESTVRVTQEMNYVTIFMKMSGTADWFTGTTMRLYHDGGSDDEAKGQFVLGSRQSTYPLDLGISSRTTFFPSQQPGGDDWLESPEPIQSFLSTSDNATLWGDNNTFAYSCGEENFPIAHFYLTQEESPQPDYPDLRIACGILGGISFLSITAAVVLWMRGAKKSSP